MGCCCSSDKGENGSDDSFYPRTSYPVHPQPIARTPGPVAHNVQQQQQPYLQRWDSPDFLHTSASVRNALAPIVRQPTAVTAATAASNPFAQSLVQPTAITRAAKNRAAQPKASIISIEKHAIAPGLGKISTSTCKACGKSDHVKTDCRYRNRMCFYCRQEGHIIAVCPAKRRHRQGRGNRKRGGSNLRN